MPFAPEHHIVYSFSGFLLDLSRGTLIQNDRDIPLRPKSFEVLRYLVEHPGQLASKEEMILAIWGHRHTSDGSLTQCIIDIRKALGDDGQSLVKTLPRRGYILDAPVELLESPPELPKVDPYHPEPGASPGSLQSRPLFTWVALLAGVLIIFTAVYFVRHEVPESSGFNPGPAGGATAANSIAVLPFIDLSPGKDQAWFAQGLSEEILNLLAKSPDLRVIARTSSFSFKDQSLDVPSIAKRLDVGNILEGSVRREADQVRITVQLVGGEDGIHLWSHTYDREMENILEMQAEIAAAVAEEMRARLVAEPTINKLVPAAYELFLRAEYFYGRRSPGDIQRAAEYYRRAVELDPDFARAWIGLSGAYNLLTNEAAEGSSELLEKQFQAAQKGLDLSPGLGSAQMRMAQAYYSMGQREKSLEYWNRAIALDPEDPFILAVRAGWANSNFRFDEAVQLQRRAVAADPVAFTQSGNLAHYLLNAGRYEEALAEFWRSIELNPIRLEDSRPFIAYTLVQLERHQEALDLAGSIEDPASRSLVSAMAHTGLGLASQAGAATQELESFDGLKAMILQAQWYAWSGNSNLAFQSLNHSLTQVVENGADWHHIGLLEAAATSPAFREIRPDPRWKSWLDALRAVEASLETTKSESNTMLAPEA